MSKKTNPQVWILGSSQRDCCWFRKHKHDSPLEMLQGPQAVMVNLTYFTGQEQKLARCHFYQPLACTLKLNPRAWELVRCHCSLKYQAFSSAQFGRHSNIH